MKSFLIIGLGRFGTALAEELSSLGHEVLAVDSKEERAQAIVDKVTRAVTCDARDPEVLRSLGVRNFDCAVVAIGNDIGGSALVTLNLKELKVPHVVCKAYSGVHRKVLEKMGADQVVLPEQEMASRLAQNLSNTDVLNFIELSDEFSIVEIKVPKKWVGETIRELDVRATYHLNIIAVRSNDNSGGEHKMNIAPGGDYHLTSEDSLVVLGCNDNIEKLEKL